MELAEPANQTVQKCAACLSISQAGGHKCIERSVDCDCPEYRTRWPAEETDAVDRMLTVLLDAAEARGAAGTAAEIRRVIAEASGDAVAPRQEA
jgi:hypothetical protein